MRCLWDVSNRSPLRETSQRPLRNISKETSFWDFVKTSQIHLKKDVFFEKSLRRLKYISKMISFFEKSLRRLKHIWNRCLFLDVSDMSQKYILKVFVTIKKNNTKMVSSWKNRCIGVKNTQKLKRRFLKAMHSH